MELIQGTLDFADSDRKDANPVRWQPKCRWKYTDSTSTGDELKDKGMAASLSKKPSQVYRDHLVDALKIFPVRSRITVEQLTAAVGRPESYGATSACVGAIINHMSKRGLIQKTGRMIKPARKERHSNEVAEWSIERYG